MAAAETARLIASLELQDKLTPGTKTATSSLNQLEGATNTANVRVGVLQGGVSKLGGAMSHAVGQVSGLVRSVGLLGGALGIGGLVVALKNSVDEAANFGAGVAKVAGVTNMSQAAASAMVDTLDKYGMAADKQVTILGRAEKNAGALAATTKKATAFQKLYNFSLTDSHGAIVDANELLLRSADYFTSNASATNKATVLTKLWGKTWTELIPLLSQGSAGVAAEEDSAIHLTNAQIANIAKFRTAQRDFSDEIMDLQIKIGATLMPTITRGLKEASAWLDTHGDEVTRFIGDAAALGEKAAGAFADVFSGLKSAWDSVPPEVRDLLIKGIATDRTIKFLFGFSPVGAAAGGIEGLLGKGFSQFLGRGSSPVNPMWVADVTGGGGGGPVNVAEDIVTKGGPLALLASIVTKFGPLALVTAAVTDIALSLGDISSHLDTNNALAAQGLNEAEIRAYKYSQMTPEEQRAATTHGFGKTDTYQSDLASALRKINAWHDGQVQPKVTAGNIRTGEHSASVPAARLLHLASTGHGQAGGEAAVSSADALAKKFADSSSPSYKSMISALNDAKALQKSAPAAIATKLQGPIDSILTTLHDTAMTKPPDVYVTSIVNVNVSAREVAQARTTQARLGPATNRTNFATGRLD